MKLKLICTLFLAVAVSFAAVACQGSDRDSDGAALAQSVRQRFDDSPELKGATARVQVRAEGDGGRIVLSGTTDTERDRQLAETFARGVEGVHEVDNRITVAAGPSTADVPSRYSATFSEEAVRKEAAESGERLGRSSEDARIYYEIRRRIIEDRTAPKRAVFVDVSDGDVTLRGMVSTVQARDAAVAAAKEVEGTRAVKDLLKINTPVP